MTSGENIQIAVDHEDGDRSVQVSFMFQDVSEAKVFAESLHRMLLNSYLKIHMVFTGASEPEQMERSELQRLAKGRAH